MDESLMSAIGTDVNGFQSELFEDIRARYGILTVLFDSPVFWTLLALLIPIGYMMNRLRRKRRYRQWERDEALHSTDFDYGDPDNPEKPDDEDRPWD